MAEGSRCQEVSCDYCSGVYCPGCPPGGCAWLDDREDAIVERWYQWASGFADNNNQDNEGDEMRVSAGVFVTAMAAAMDPATGEVDTNRLAAGLNVPSRPSPDETDLLAWLAEVDWHAVICRDGPGAVVGSAALVVRPVIEVGPVDRSGKLLITMRVRLPDDVRLGMVWARLKQLPDVAQRDGVWVYVLPVGSDSCPTLRAAADQLARIWSEIVAAIVGSHGEWCSAVASRGIDPTRIGASGRGAE